MALGFAKAAVDLPPEDWRHVERYNICLERLASRRKNEVTVTDQLAESKAAWKCAVLQQALLYRVTMLAKGCADSWNAGNIVCSILAGRTLMEAVALSVYVADELLKQVEDRNIEAVHSLANEQLFSTRNEGPVVDGLGHLAPSVLKFIDKFDKWIDGVRKSYEFLCDWSHPNGGGHLFTYGNINKQTGAVSFSEATPRVKGAQGHVLTCFMVILFMEPVMDKFDSIVLRTFGIERTTRKSIAGSQWR